jgi:hypothetical protein
LFSEYGELHRFRKRRSMSFDQWVPDVLAKVKADLSAHDNHLRRQCELICPRTEIFRFEFLAEGIAEVTNRLGIKNNHIEQHLNSGEAEEYKQAYASELVDLVANHREV